MLPLAEAVMTVFAVAGGFTPARVDAPSDSSSFFLRTRKDLYDNDGVQEVIAEAQSS